MIVGFSRYSQGPAREPIDYFTSERNPDGTKRDPPPEVLRGNPELIGKLIDSLSFEHVYTSGCTWPHDMRHIWELVVPHLPFRSIDF